MNGATKNRSERVSGSLLPSRRNTFSSFASSLVMVLLMMLLVSLPVAEGSVIRSGLTLAFGKKSLSGDGVNGDNEAHATKNLKPDSRKKRKHKKYTLEHKKRSDIFAATKSPPDKRRNKGWNQQQHLRQHVHMNVDVHMDVNGKENFPLSSPVWSQSHSHNPNQQESSNNNNKQQQQGFPAMGFLLTAGGMGGKRFFLRQQLQRLQQAIAIPSSLALPSGVITARNGKLLAAATVLVGTTRTLLHDRETIERAATFWYRCGPMVAHYKFTKWWLKASGAPLEHRDAVYKTLHDKYAPTAYSVALDLKGLYVKLCQVASSRPDFVPGQYLELFVKAQDSLPQWPIEDVTAIINKTLSQLNDKHNTNNAADNNMHYSYESVFEDIDEIALGSASIGQCHRARIRKEYAQELLQRTNAPVGSSTAGTVDVAVKVMHPGSEERFRHDFKVFRWLCRVALKGWEPILDECYRQIMSEFDYQREAGSLDAIRTNMSKSPFHESIKVPKPVLGLCGKELLVMELLDGPKLSDSLEGELAEILGEEKSKQLLERKRLELILGPDKLKALESLPSSSNGSEAPTREAITEASLLKDCGLKTKLRLFSLYKRAQSTIDLLVDVQGYQMLRDGIFQGDPHPGNILALRARAQYPNHIGSKILGRTKNRPLLGLIDYGQTKAITDEERLGVARVILALAEASDDEDIAGSSIASVGRVETIAKAMRDLGFETKRNDPGVLAQYAGLFFDSDEAGKRLYDCPTPQTYFKLLTEMDPLLNVPDVAVFVARCGFLLRGAGTMLGKQIRTSKRWSIYAKQALEEHEEQQTNGE